MSTRIKRAPSYFSAEEARKFKQNREEAIASVRKPDDVAFFRQGESASARKTIIALLRLPDGTTFEHAFSFREQQRLKASATAKGYLLAELLRLAQNPTPGNGKTHHQKTTPKTNGHALFTPAAPQASTNKASRIIRIDLSEFETDPIPGGGSPRNRW